MSKSQTRPVMLLRLGSARYLTRSVRVGVFHEPLNPMLYYYD